MKLQQFFTLNLVFALFFGLSGSIFPEWALQLYGITPNDFLIWLTRLACGSILGFATLMWFGRKAANQLTRRAIAFALLTQDLIGFVACLDIQLSGSRNALGWTDPLLYGFLALGYIYFLYIKPEKS
jgi:hypothetical protein